jgi:hypothetical protein
VGAHFGLRIGNAPGEAERPPAGKCGPFQPTCRRGCGVGLAPTATSGLIEKRREALARLIAKRRGNGILFSEALAEEGAVVFAKACELGLEGIVSKREGSFYKSGRSRNWLKTKNPDFVRTRAPYPAARSP